jgi:hypothetical protein
MHGEKYAEKTKISKEMRIELKLLDRKGTGPVVEAQIDERRPALLAEEKWCCYAY